MLHNNYTQDDYKSYHVIIAADQENNRGELLLGDLNAATDVALMKDHNVKTIITAASGLEHLKIPPEQTHIVFPLLDLKTQNIQAYFQLSFQTIDQNLKRGSVLVHCGAGISRSATLVIAYYMKKYDTMFINALKHVRKIRSNVCPNLGFEMQLKKYQEQLSMDSTKNSQHLQKQELGVGSKKQPVKAKQMNLTFNAPTTTRRMGSTNTKNFGSHTPAIMRKVPHSSHKRILDEKDLFIVGHQPKAESQHQSAYNAEQYCARGWGLKRKDNSLKL